MVSRISMRLALVALMFVFALGTVLAQDPPDRGNGGGKGRGDGHERAGNEHLLRCLGTLDLSQEVKDQIKAILDGAAATAAAGKTALDEMHTRLRAAHRDRDRDAAQAIKAEIEAKHAELRAAHEAAHAAILALLTEAQRASLKDCLKRGPKRGDRGRNDAQDCFAKLDLSDEQKAAIKVIREEHMADHREEMAAIRALHTELRAARKAGDAALVAELRAQITAKMEALKTAQAALREEILGVLTAEQRAALEDCLENRGSGSGDNVTRAPRLN